MLFQVRKLFVALIFGTISCTFLLYSHLATQGDSEVVLDKEVKRIVKRFVPADENLASFIDHLREFRDDMKKLLRTETDVPDGTDVTFTKAQHDKMSLRKRIESFMEEAEKFLQVQNLKRINLPVRSSNTEKNFSCPEIYKGSTYGYPFFRRGFVTTNCSKIPINKSVTILIFDYGNIRPDHLHHLTSVIKAIKGIYPGIKVNVVTNEIVEETARKKLAEYGVNNIYQQLPADKSVFNAVVENITSAFTLVLPSPSKFDFNSDLERLVRVLTHSKLRVEAVGGAVKNSENGHWNKACLQTKLSNYVFSKTLGYYRSLNECLICDSLGGPFLTRTATLKKLPLENLGKGTFEDWFWRIKLQNAGLKDKYRILSCPDVMFTQKTLIADYELVKFTKKWEIKKIIEPDRKVRWYGCRNGIAHEQTFCAWSEGMAIPPCCRANLADAIKYFMKTCEENNITCELQEGTHLGAVKFDNVLPWERDADLTFLTADFSRIKELKAKLSDGGLYLGTVSEPWCCADGIYAGGVFNIRAGRWHMELYGQHIMDSDQTRKRGGIPTKIKFDDTWVQVPDNPGQFARNRYGKEIYRHREHWMTLGHTSGWDPYNPGRFEACRTPGHHGCLDQFEADGNLQFIRDPL